MQTLWAGTVLLPSGWAKDVQVEIDAGGRLVSVAPGVPAEGLRLDILLPAPANLHSHAFQRAMAGLTERRGPGGRDSFWTWRELMYRFVDRLSPEHVEAIAAFAYVEMLEAGYASVGEFHYLHHAKGGTCYASIGEMSERIVAASQTAGIGLTLLPVLYQTAGCDGRPVEDRQRRFYNDPDRFLALVDAATGPIDALSDGALGLAPHSLRSVTPAGLAAIAKHSRGRPIHIHAAEQTAEVDEVCHYHGARPVAWLLNNAEIGPDWCLIHATHMEAEETEALARSGAVAGLCPLTEANLGDGIFDGARYQAAGGRWGVGTDSNIRISLHDELRQLEHSQRLRDRGRAVLATTEQSNGRTMLDAVTAGGAQAIARGAAGIETGAWADLLALDGGAIDLRGRSDDILLDSFVMAGRRDMVREVWSAGRHMVREGRHIAREAVENAYQRAIDELADDL
ncbi:MAG: formimidoylglutamate deiminase [Rhodobacter sp.]|nr:formimidoylglutamate deiminase [Rhodobacter sp.]